MKKKLRAGGLLIIVITLFVSYYLITMNQVSQALSKYGSRGDEVKQIQTKLKNWGYYSGSVDGIYGSGTLAAVKKFQQKNGLTVDRNSRNKNLASNGNI